MEYRIKKDELAQTLQAWDELLPGRGRIRLVACGGTALTLMGYKESTKDVDFLVPEEKEYERLIDFLTKAGYRPATSFGWKRGEETIVYDLYPGKKVYQTELLTSPLVRGGTRPWKKLKKIEVLILNPLDLIISKMFRGVEVDIQDSLLLLAKEKIDLEKLKERYRETAQHDISEAKVLRNLELLLKRLESSSA
ncbi:MAG TPA: hypothetical protein P5561_06065 [Candidatus Omnitrophota bacterium]|nr:hypothetical protein [Candidatus Omnitrophota bacterium]HRY86073.1 hypothetical protein [Candidatus Omnitrophota bacterium]